LKSPSIDDKIVKVHTEYFKNKIIEKQAEMYNEFYHRFTDKNPETTNFTEFKYIIAYLYEGIKFIEKNTNNKVHLLSILSLKC